MFVKFEAPRGRAPQGKLAEVVLQFSDSEGTLLAGLELHGLTVWQRRDGSGRFLSLPGREYVVTKDGQDQRKTFDFLRYTNKTTGAKVLDNLKALILEQYEEWSQQR